MRRYCCDHENCQRVPYREVYFKRGGWGYACRPHFNKLRVSGRLTNWCAATPAEHQSQIAARAAKKGN